MSGDDRLKFSRRDFIISLLSAMAATTTLHGCGSAPDGGQIRQRLSLTIGDQAAAKHFGQVYLEEHPSETDIELLLKRIGGDMNLNDPELLAERLDQQVRNEYRRGESVMVNGWVLSRTEARLYALVTLL